MKNIDLSNVKCATLEEITAEPIINARAGNPSGEAPPMGDIPGWKDIYTDDFDAPRSDWNIPSNFPYEHSDVVGSNTKVGNSLMRIKGEKKSASERTTVGWACLKQNPKIIPQYGKFLVRMRADKMKGLAIAALTWPNSEKWPQDGEIDFAEDFSGARQLAAFSHFAGPDGKDQFTTHQNKEVDGSAWATWGCEWTPTTLKYTVDGKVWAQETNTKAIPHNPHWLGFVMSCHYPEVEVKTAFWEIDWIKIYSYAPATNPPVVEPPKPPADIPVPVGAFKGEYYSTVDFKNLTLVRKDDLINFDWKLGSPDPKLPINNFSVRWTGDFEFAAGVHKFTMASDDGVKVYVDDQLIIDKYITQAETPHSAEKTLTAGIHRVKIEYFEAAGSASAKFSMTPVTLSPPPVPTQKPVLEAALVSAKAASKEMALAIAKLEEAILLTK